MKDYTRIKEELIEGPRRWLVTGAAGFIGSNIVEQLLTLNQTVVGLDNFATGHKRNLEQTRDSVTRKQWGEFTFIDGDICDPNCCRTACRQIDYVLHQAALGSVPRSIEDPLRTNASNVDGFLNVLVAARDAKVRRFVYAASSSTYGDHPGLPKVEERIGAPLSPYAVTKLVNELYADVCARCYGLESVGLRYFNVFGPRQDPEGAYAAVIPKWIAAMIRNQPTEINGDGESSRDFCFVENAVQANILAARADQADAVNQVYNVAVGERTTLNELFRLLRDRLAPQFPHLTHYEPIYREFRSGDVRHSQADVNKARRLLGFSPTHTVAQGLDASFEWYLRNIV